MTDKQLTALVRLIANIAFMIPYVWIFFERENSPPWLLIPILVWGLFGFRWIAEIFVGKGPFNVNVSLGELLALYAIGAVVCGVLGPAIIPLLVIYHLIQLIRLCGKP